MCANPCARIHVHTKCALPYLPRHARVPNVRFGFLNRLFPFPRGKKKPNDKADTLFPSPPQANDGRQIHASNEQRQQPLLLFQAVPSPAPTSADFTPQKLSSSLAAAGGLSPAYGSTLSSRGDWTFDQDNALRAAVHAQGGKNWKKIALEIPGEKTHVQCLQRWNKVIKPGLIKGPWKPAEDDMLRMSVDEISKNNWVAVSDRVPGRTPKQCRERWLLCLDPKIRKEKWTVEEDSALLQLHREHGNAWAFLAKQLEGRTENAIKSRMKSLQKKINRSCPGSGSKPIMGTAATANPQMQGLFAPVTSVPRFAPFLSSTPPSWSAPSAPLTPWPQQTLQTQQQQPPTWDAQDLLQRSTSGSAGGGAVGAFSTLTPTTTATSSPSTVAAALATTVSSSATHATTVGAGLWEEEEAAPKSVAVTMNAEDFANLF
ncbi:hypothetical protein BASA81_011320 [Batrachochytrium salamandrivorans]|nr:hypothetical protein BASA81_011320 [Batrachochytrium salamandrivorans]